MATPHSHLLPPFSEIEQGDYLKSINKKLYDIKDEFQHTVEENMAAFMGTLDQTTILSQQVERVTRELKTVRSRVSDHQQSLFSVVIDSTRKRRALMERERHTGILIKVLEALADVNRNIKDYAALIEQRNLLPALRQREKLKSLIVGLPGSYAEGQEPIIYTTVKREFEKLNKEFIDFLQSSLTSAFKYNPATGSISITSPDTPSSMSDGEELLPPFTLATCLAALHSFDLAQPKIAFIATQLLNFIDTFIVDPSKSPVLNNLKVSFQEDLAILQIVETKHDGSPHSEIKQGLSATITFFHFLTEHLVNPLQKEFSRIESSIGTTLKNAPDVYSPTPISALCVHLGELVLSHVIDKLVHCCFEYCIPEKRSQLEQYQTAITAEVDRFIPVLDSFKWLHQDGATEQSSQDPSRVIPRLISSSPSEKFGTFLKNAYLHFAIKKKNRILARSRQLLLSRTYTSSVVGEVGLGFVSASPGASQDDLMTVSPFKFPECRVRTVIVELMELCDNLLSDAFAPPPEGDNLTSLEGHRQVQMILLETTKDVLDLYRAIVPSLEQIQVGNIPFLAMLFHNDCQYIAHQIALLVAKYRIQLNEVGTNPVPTLQSSPFSPAPLVHHATTSSIPVNPTPTSPNGRQSLKAASAAAVTKDIKDSSPGTFSLAPLGPAFRSLAEKFYSDIVNAVQEHLKILAEPMQQLQATHLEERQRDCLTAARDIVAEIQRTDLAWSEPLSRELHKVTMGSLVNKVTEWMVASVLALKDISSTESESLYLIFTAMFPLAKIFVDIEDTTMNMAIEAQQAATRAACAKYVRSWDRFEDLADAFNMKMVDIVRKYNDGDMHFSREETVHLIKALFEESTNRQNRIESLRKGEETH